MKFIKITAKNKTNPSDVTTLCLGQDAYSANDLYSGSPVIYPLLSEVPVVTRSVGTTDIDAQTISIKTFGFNKFTSDELTLNDLRDVLDFHNAKVEVIAVVSGAESVRQTLLIDGLTSTNEGFVNMTCYETLVRDVEVNKVLTSSQFPYINDKYDGVTGNVVFSDGASNEVAIVELIPIQDLNNVGEATQCVYYVGWQDGTNTPIQGLNKIYAKNKNTEFNANDWVPLNLPTADNTVLKTSIDTWYNAPTGSIDLSNYSSLALVNSIATVDGGNGRILTHAAISCALSGVADDEAGELKLTISQADNLATSGGTYTNKGRVLTTASFNLTGAFMGATSGVLFAPLQPFVAIGDDMGGTLGDWSSLLYEISWSNRNGDTSILLHYLDEPGYITYEKADSKGDDPQYTRVTGKKLGVEVLSAYSTASGLTSYPEYATFYIQTVSGYVTVSDKASNPLSDIELKAGISGMKDVNGLYTTNSGFITYPDDIAKYLLINYGGLSSSDIVITDTENKLSSQGMTFSLDKIEKIHDVISDVSKLGLTYMGVDRVGKRTFTRLNFVDSPSYIIDDPDLVIVNLEDLNYSSVSNQVEVKFNEDELNETENKYYGRVVIDSNEDSESDTDRKLEAETSQTKYGVRDVSIDANLYIGRNKALRLARYTFDRNNQLQKKLTLKLPYLDRYLDLDILDFVEVRSAYLPNEHGNNEDLKLLGDTVIEYDHAINTVARGSFSGYIQEMTEGDDFIELVIFSTGSFL